MERNEIFINNFLKYLELSKKTQKQYETENDIALSTVTKWKKRLASPSIEQVYQAAQYFNITVNDLLYDEEKKKSIEVLADNNYSPIVAQKINNFKYINKGFKNPIFSSLVLLLIGIFIIFSVAIFSLINQLFVYSLIVIIPLFLYTFSKIVIKEEKFIINYTDSLYYETSKLINNSFRVQIIINILQLIFLIRIPILLVNLKEVEISNPIIITFFIVSLSLLILSLDSILKINKDVNKKVNDNELIRIMVPISNTFLNIIFILFIVFFLDKSDLYIIYLIGSSVLLIGSFINLVIEFNMYNCYSPVYYENNEKEIRIKI